MFIGSSARPRPPNLIETAALAKIREDQFADAAETAEIRSDENLAKRLNAGSRDARNRRGRFTNRSVSP